MSVSREACRSAGIDGRSARADDDEQSRRATIALVGSPSGAHASSRGGDLSERQKSVGPQYLPAYRRQCAYTKNLSTQ